MNENEYYRICIFGRPGSGKSTFSYKLSKITNLPLYHLDKYFFVANWIERDYNEFLSIQQDLVNQNQWIIDGNSLQSLEMRYARAQVCLYFNYSRMFCLWRLVKRLFKKNPAIEDRAKDCKEKISWKLIKYMWTFETRKNGRLTSQIFDLRKRYPDVKFIEIRNDYELEKICKLLDL